MGLTLLAASAAADVKPDAFEPVCQYCADYYWRFVWYLPYFAGEWTHKVRRSCEGIKSVFGGQGKFGTQDEPS